MSTLSKIDSAQRALRALAFARKAPRGSEKAQLALESARQLSGNARVSLSCLRHIAKKADSFTRL